MSSFDKDFDWQRQFIPQIKMILAQHLIEEAPFEEDARHNTDLLVLQAKVVRVACRVRHHKFVLDQRYRDQFTIRESRPSGVETELPKVLRGWGDRIFYGFADETETAICAWMLGDLDEFRLWHHRMLWKLPAGHSPGELIPNRDGTTGRAYRIDELPDQFLIARKHFASMQGVA